MNKSFIEVPLLIVGRLFLSAIFLWSGVGKVMDFSGTQSYMESKGMPLVTLFLLGAIAFEILGGLSVLLGFKARWGALLLVSFLIPTTLLFHSFWAVEEARQSVETIQFMKNTAILGGLLLMVSTGAEKISIDALLKRRKTTLK